MLEYPPLAKILLIPSQIFCAFSHIIKLSSRNIYLLSNLAKPLRVERVPTMTNTGFSYQFSIDINLEIPVLGKFWDSLQFIL